MQYNDSDKRKADKIFKRLCKDAGIFPTHFYKDLVSFFNSNKTFIFYGRDGANYSSIGVDCEIKFYKLQFDFAKRLIQEDTLNYDDYFILTTDTLLRYDITKVSDSVDLVNKWKRVLKESNKKEFVDFFINQYEKKFGRTVSTKLISQIYKTVSCM